MKRLALLLLSLVLVISLFEIPCFSAAVTDDATDGILVWQGYEWTAECLKDEYVGTSYLSNTEPCTHGWLFVDDENCMNFKGIPSGDKVGKFHKIELPRENDNGMNQIDWGSSFDVEFEMKIESFGEGFGLQFYDDSMRAYLVFKEYGIQYHANDKYYFVNLALGNEWNTYRCVKNDSQFTLYVNGGVVCSYKVPALKTSNEAAVQFYATAADYNAANFKLRNFEVKRNETPITMTPDYNQKFGVGEDVVLKADVDDGAEYVNYYVGDVLVGTATAGNDYAYTLENLPQGTFSVYGETSTGKRTNVRNFSVVTDLWAKISCSENIRYGESATLSLEDVSHSGVDYVEYYVNGILTETSLDAPYSISVSNLPVGNSSVYAKVYFQNGTYVDSETKIINVTNENGGAFELKEEYDLAYSVSSKGEMQVNDGYFLLSLKHSDEGIVYETRDGSATYEVGTGDFRIVTASGIADVYRNGQLAFSYYLPGSQAESGIKCSGAENVFIGGSGVKTEVFRRNITDESSVVCEEMNNGLFYSVEFDKADASDETLVFYDGEYEIYLNFKDGIYSKAQVVSEAEISKQCLSNSVTPGYYRLTVYRGLAQLFCNNRFIGSVRAPRNSHKKTLRRVLSNPMGTTFVAIKNTDDAFYFEDCFDGNGERDSLEYWYRIYGNTAATIENNGMNISGDGVYLFDATAENAEFAWTMTPTLTETVTESSSGKGCEGENGSSSVTKQGKFAIGVRYRTELDNVKIKYDHSSGNWTLVESVGGKEKTLATKSLIIANNQAEDCRLSVKNNSLTFTYGGESIFSDVKLSFLGNGKFGFVLDNETELTIDNMSYSGNGKVNSGVNYSLWSEQQFSGTIDFYPVNESGEVAAHKTGKYYSTIDKGESWQGPFSASPTGSHTLILESGKRLVLSDWGGQSHASLYDSEGNALFENRVVQASATDKVGDRCSLGGRIIQTRKIWGTAPDAKPRVFYVTSQGSETNGITTVYYSDDEGNSWKQSHTVMDFENMGDFYGGEADIVDLPDDRIRVYFRTDRSFLCYVDSFDGGVTFSNEPITSQFMTPSTAFAIERDPEQTHTYYMYWSYDVTTATADYIQYPRNRVAVAVSYDGCESWEYILEYDDRGVEWIGAHCNSSMRVFDGIVYVNFGYLGDKGKFSNDLTVAQVIMVIDPSKMTTVKRFANAHYVEPNYKSVYDHVQGQTVISKNGSGAMIDGQLVSGVNVNGGMVEASVVANALGAEVSETSDGIVLSIGDGRVEFKKGLAEYIVNSENVIADETCLSEDGNYLNLRVCAKIFGKTYVETDSSMLLLAVPLAESFTTEMEQITGGISNEINKCIRDFVTIADSVALRDFFEKYKMFLNIDTKFSGTAYANMFDVYAGLDLTEITDYDSLMQAIDILTTNEKSRAEAFLNELNQASQAGDGNAIKVLFTETYRDLISVDIDMTEIKNADMLFEKMTGLTYNSIVDAENVYLSAYKAQISFEKGENNSLSVSTVSEGFENWVGFSDDTVGGYSTEVKDGENVVTLSAYEGRKGHGKTTVNDVIDGVVYQEPGKFGTNTARDGASADYGNGILFFEGAKGSFVVNGATSTQSHTMITVFDMKKSEGTVKGTFTSGKRQTVIDFGDKGTSLGKLPEELAEAEEITYRVEMSMNDAVLLAKKKSASDKEYYLIGKTTNTSSTASKWSVKFTTENSMSEISELGVYSALSGVRYDNGGMRQRDNLYFSSKGEAGHTMTDLVNAGATRNNVTVDESGRLVLAKETVANSDGTTSVQANSYVSLENLLSGDFDRAELDLTVSADAGSRIYLYFCDNSGFRYAAADFKPSRFNDADTGYGFSWETGQFYNIKLITNVAGYDESGQARTSASMYVKKAGDEKWVCVANEQLMTKGQKLNRNSLQLTLMNISNDKKIIYDKIALKTYCRDKGNYEFANASVNMPETDYVFTFDYMRMDDDVPTELVIGGTDYRQKIIIDYYRVFTNDTYVLSIDADIGEDKWYRFFGKVTMTEEKPYVNNNSKILKNEISLYAEDEDGNVITLFENLPMLKVEGSNGIRFSMKNTDDAGVRLKNIRVYSGKVADFVSAEVDGEVATVAVDFLNDEYELTKDFTAYAAVYDENRLCGIGSANVTDDIKGFGTKRIDFMDIKHKSQKDETPQFRVFVWDTEDGLIPLTDLAEGKAEKNNQGGY